MLNKDLVFPNEFKTSVYLKNVIKAKNIHVGNYTYYDCPSGDPLEFETKNVLFNYEIFGDQLIIGNFYYGSSQPSIKFDFNISI